MHKTLNMLNALPKSVQAQAKQAPHDIWQTETKPGVEKAFDKFIETYKPKYPKATCNSFECGNRPKNMTGHYRIYKEPVRSGTAA